MMSTVNAIEKLLAKELKGAFEHHLRETEGQIQRLDRVTALK
jgi:ferritin-like metal-binding protein YciE